jgi:hypothetical protein
MRRQLRLGPADIRDHLESKRVISEIMTQLEKKNSLNPNCKTDFMRLDKLMKYSDLCAETLASYDKAILKDDSMTLHC